MICVSGICTACPWITRSPCGGAVCIGKLIGFVIGFMYAAMTSTQTRWRISWHQCVHASLRQRTAQASDSSYQNCCAWSCAEPGDIDRMAGSKCAAPNSVSQYDRRYKAVLWALAPHQACLCHCCHLHTSVFCCGPGQTRSTCQLAQLIQFCAIFQVSVPGCCIWWAFCLYNFG